ncbi:MAG: hypothetical protein LBQ15_07780 [Clostridium sp.]|jgi:hypothetical protein|nr:hypothetical protein [Clostridium sp.]
MKEANPASRKHLEGVFCTTKKNGEVSYRSSLTYRRKHISLGSYRTEDAAHLAYRAASELVAPGSRISLRDYEPSSPLPFEKWVVLLNFRDNGLYLGVPIYIRPRFFYYYLSPDQILKFDKDDLFYYASRKIMCRGSRYFVADYGMQVSIASRYGIRSYAVTEVDYRFRNGDPTDFRRENIEILNRFHGVRKIMKNGRCLYAARIHIRGNFLIGTYETDVEAAIAYNKAIDILRKKNVTKRFPPNYVEELSARQYAELYSKVKISPRILSYCPP